MIADQIHRVRSFNRTVTQRVGALNNSFLDRGRPLSEARLIYEIGENGAELRQLREKLALDSGYLSRLFSNGKVLLKYKTTGTTPAFASPL